MKTATSVLWIFSFCSIFSLAAAEEAAVIKASRVNVRGQARLASEVVTQLKKDDAVTILEEIAAPNAKPGEPAAWLRIKLPANTPVWVNANFVSNNLVTVNKLNVRSGPGENYSVLARLDKGAEVKAIRTVGGDWTEIEAPAGAFAFIGSELVSRPNKPAAPETISAANTTTAPPAPAPEPVKLEPAPAPAPAPAPTVETKSAATTTPAPVVPVTTPEPAPAPPALAPEIKTESASTTVAAPPAISPTREIVVEEIAPKRIVTREGFVRLSVNIQTPTFYALESLDNGKTINYLHSTSTNLQWKVLKDRKVIVTGEEAIDKRWPNTPVLVIETLKTTP
ncbi:MAG: SH3 domain-containing protein [Verrucomicrobia bacterium]|nr:SH3 domain-containing protein [Verrucomicrobiota bacterium]